MRISDWSSDVCSSDLMQVASASTEAAPRPTRLWDLNFGYVIDGRDVPWKPLTVYDDGAKTVIRFAPEVLARKAPALLVKIGRASWRERVCQSVSISVVAVSLKKKQKNIQKPKH